MFIKKQKFNDLVNYVNDLGSVVRELKDRVYTLEGDLRKATTLSVPVINKDGKPTSYYDFSHTRKRFATISLTDLVRALLSETGNKAVCRVEEPQRLELHAVEPDDDRT